ncbi:hypothetical protein TcG_06087 [Trypanosoma cruzi]|nr:hypothetical protein TcG_06087 [Trypanosoma cruzi]
MVPASLLFPCDTLPRLLLSAAAFTSPCCGWISSSSSCPFVSSVGSPFSPELAPASGFTVGPSCPSPSVVGVFASAVSEIPTGICGDPFACVVSPPTVPTAGLPSDEESTFTFLFPS